jgi:hypothetical protein
MDVLDPAEIDSLIAGSKLVPFYNREVDRESAHEILGKKIENARQTVAGSPAESAGRTVEPRQGRGGMEKEPPSVLEELSKNPMARQIGRTLVRELTRGLFGVLGGSKRRR